MSAPAKESLGTLVVVVLKARNLRDKHKVSKQDPYATVKLGRVAKSTKVEKRGGQHPVWDEDLHLPVPANATTENRILKVQCFAKESREDDLIGEGSVDIAETLKTKEFDDWVKIEENGAYRGEVYLEMTFFPSQPTSTSRPPNSPSQSQSYLTPPLPLSLQRRPSKLPKQERLWRPSETPPQTSPYLQAGSLHGSNSGASSPSLSPVRHTPSPKRDAPLPPAPPDSDVPPLRMPVPGPAYGTGLEPGPRPSHGGARLQAVPSVLRPGNVKSSPVPIPQRRFDVVPGPSYAPVADPYPADPYPAQPEFEEPPLPDPYLLAAQRTFDRPAHAPAPAPPPDLPSRPPHPSAAQSASQSSSQAQSRHRTQEDGDAELARRLAHDEGIDIEKLRAEEADEDYARALAREINKDVVQESVRRGQRMPGSW